MSLLTVFLIGVLQLYRAALSPFLGSQCRFYPSCSCYAEQALERKGFMKSLPLVFRRILKCHPWNSGGFDPVD